MGIKFPSDLDAWYHWQEQAKTHTRLKRMLKTALTSVRKSPKESGADVAVVTGALHVQGTNPQLLVVLDTVAPTTLHSLVRPLKFMSGFDFAVWAPEDVSDLLPGGGWSVLQCCEEEIEAWCPSLRSVLSTGHYMGYGAAGYRLAQRTGARFITVQHGLHTPYAPPLAPDTHLLAFSDADAHFWISGRTDITYDVVGSQLFWDAAQKPKIAAEDLEEQVLFLGQMHGTELPRTSFIRSTVKFVKEHRAVYRPHPQEKDKLSKTVHALMQKMGMVIDRSQKPLNQVNNPVVAIFSTGIIEAAIRGVPAWAYHTDPPEWLTEFWERYGMSRWGGEPTPAPALPAVEPAQRIAEIITQQLEK